MAILTSIKSKGPDGVFYGGMDPQAGPMLRQMEQLGLSNVKFFGGDGVCTAKLADLSAGAKTLGNVVCAEGGSSLEKMPGGTAWKAKYDAKYPGQFQVYSPYVYDAVFVLVDAMKRANSATPRSMPEAVRNQLHRRDREGGLRERWRTEEPGDDPVRLQGRQEGSFELMTRSASVVKKALRERRRFFVSARGYNPSLRRDG